MGHVHGRGDCPLAVGDADGHHCAWCGAPLTGRRTRWCSTACADAWGVNHHWTTARAAARARDHGRCVQCGSRDRVQVHHLHPTDEGYVESCCHHQANLVTLCHMHHVEAHARLRARMAA